MRTRYAILPLLMAIPALCQDWSPRLAAEYLDGRQKDWSAWRAAKAPGGTCMSCHTGATYLFARPALSAALHQSQPTSFETDLLSGIRYRVGKQDQSILSPGFTKDPLLSQAIGVEAVYAALFLVRDDAGKGSITRQTLQAFDRLWSLQIANGEGQGAWPWFSLNLDPFEMPESRFYGATLAALAVGTAPESYRNQPQVRTHVEALLGYLRDAEKSQPLHNRLMQLWASKKLPEALPDPQRNVVLKQIWEKQEADGGWTLEALGPWSAHPAAPPAVPGSNSYATALTAFTLRQAGIAATDPKMKKALDWLRSHQNPQLGYWDAQSLNKHYEAGSNQIRFMQDAATSFAVLALLAPQ